MNWIDRTIAAVNPQAAVRRAQARYILAHYDANKNTRLRKMSRKAGSGDAVSRGNALALMNTVRDMERNHDLVRGAISAMVRNVVGPNGIGVEPQPRNSDDSINDDFARQIQNLYREFCESPCVTGRRTMAQVQRLAARSWLRDGDVFTQLVSGPASINYATPVRFALELIESEVCPHEYDVPAEKIVMGVQLNEWRAPRAYYFYKGHPNDDVSYVDPTNLKEVNAANVAHLLLSDRISQVRGLTILASALERLEDVKDYEASERIAARIAASMAAYIRKGAPDQFIPSDDNDARELQIRPGMVFDDLRAGEEVGVIKSDRPNSGLGEFRRSQVRAAAAGIDMSYSTFGRDYDGTYSAQRQELVEIWPAYTALSHDFIAMWLRPVYRRFITTALAQGLIKVPRGVRPETVFWADFLPPPMPWIDPLKEIEARIAEVEAGARSLTSVIRERSGSMQDVFEQIHREQALAKELNLTLRSNYAHQVSTKATPDAKNQPVQNDEDAPDRE